MPAPAGNPLCARCAVIGVDSAALPLLRECFQEFHIDMADLGQQPGTALESEKFDACILPLDDRAESLLEAARNSALNRRMVIYGICNTPEDAVRFSHYGINAIFLASSFPGGSGGNGKARAGGDRQAVMRVVQATYRMVVNEMRRHIRVPMVTEVRLDSGGRRFTAYSQEIGAGGISLTGVAEMPSGQPAELSFVLLESPRIHVNAAVSWFKAPDEVGLGFNREDPRRLHVRDWVERYLENS